MKIHLLKARAILKTLSWRFIASLITTGIIFALTGKIMLAFSVIGIELFTKMFLYYAHEKGWSYIQRPIIGTKKRALYKTISWRVFASIDTLIIILFFTGEAIWATSATGLEIILKTVIFYYHERVWNHFRIETDMVDFHTHSTFSDGTLTPEEIVDLAVESGCSYLAITDHDNVENLKHINFNDDRIRCIPGVELSAEFPKTLHILGYNMDVDNTKLRNTLEDLQSARRERNEKMLVKLAEHNMPMTMDELMQESKGGIVGRPHFAAIMMQKGYVKNRQEAFDRFLANGKPFYMPKTRLQPKAAIELITQAGGIAVMAHPYQTELKAAEMDELLKELVSYGLQGIEAFYSQHDHKQTRQYIHLAKKYGLLMTAGSDFHGKNKAHIPLSMTVESYHITPFLEALEK